MRRESSILPRSSRFRKMFSAGGQVPAHTVAPASAKALAMAKPYPPSSATPATRARLLRRSMLSIRCPSRVMRDARCEMREIRDKRIPHPASRIPSQEESRRHRNQLRVPNQRVGKDPAQRPLLGRDRVRGTCEGVEELVVQLLERPLESIVLEVIVPEELHPSGVIRREPPRTRVSGPNRRRRDPAAERAPPAG